MDAHRLAEERSLAYHRAVAQRLHVDATLERWRIGKAERPRLEVAHDAVPGR
jgi:hypothetical protein